MNHNSLDKERALEPSNPQSAHIYRHRRCCCWFYLKLGNAGLRLQQGRTMWRQMHVLQLKLVLSVSVGMTSLVQKYVLFQPGPQSLTTGDLLEPTLRDTYKNVMVISIAADLWNPWVQTWANREREGKPKRNNFLLLPNIPDVPPYMGGSQILLSCFIFSGHQRASFPDQWNAPDSHAICTVTIWHLPYENTSSPLVPLILSSHWQKCH